MSKQFALTDLSDKMGKDGSKGLSCFAVGCHHGHIEYWMRCYQTYNLSIHVTHTNNPPHFKPQTILSQHCRLCSLWLFTYFSHTTLCPGNADQRQQFNTYFSQLESSSLKFDAKQPFLAWRQFVELNINNKTISQMRMLMTSIPRILCTHWHQEQPLGWSPSDLLSRISLLLDSSVPMLQSC